MVTFAQAINGTNLKVTMISYPSFGCIIILQSELAPAQSTYKYIVSYLRECNYATFK